MILIELLTSPESKKFISENESANPASLALKHSNDKKLLIQLLVSQVKSRQKAKNKLPEWYQTENIIFPHGVPMEQCSSELSAKYKSSLIKGKHIVDLTGGTGIDTYYISRQFEKATYVEQDEELCNLAKHNFNVLNSNIKVENTLAQDYLNESKEHTDCYFIDPARRSVSNKKVIRIEECQPNLMGILPQMLRENTKVLVKFSPMLDIKNALQTIPSIKELYVVSVNNECKEILLLIEDSYQGGANINAVNITKKRTDKFTFTYQKEIETASTFSPPQNYLYEANTSILKAGGFKSIAAYFKLNKLQVNSHLYTSDTLVGDFKGRIFQIIDTIQVSRKALYKHLESGKANLTIRNFPLTTEQLKKKLGLKDGGDIYVFATTLNDGKHRLIVCMKVPQA